MINTVENIIEEAGFSARSWSKGSYERVYVKKGGRDMGYVEINDDGSVRVKALRNKVRNDIWDALKQTK